MECLQDGESGPSSKGMLGRVENDSPPERFPKGSRCRAGGRGSERDLLLCLSTIEWEYISEYHTDQEGTRKNEPLYNGVHCRSINRAIWLLSSTFNSISGSTWGAVDTSCSESSEIGEEGDEDESF